MNDTNNLPNDQSTQFYYANGSTSWQIWRKPKNAKLISFFVIGSGGGGGSGGVGNVVVAKSGAGGGGSSAYSYTTMPAFAVPDTVYIQVAKGGTGAASSTSATSGSAGGISFVSAAPSTGGTDLIIASGTTAAGGGAGAVTGGVAGSVFNPNTAFVLQISLPSGEAGIVGGAGGNPGANITPQLIVSPGAGGAGTNSSGGAIAGAGINSYGPFIGLSGGSAGGSAGGTARGGNGNDGVSWFNNPQYPLFFSGGAGGGSSDGGTGGRGGNGGYGCGGGGGGAGYQLAANGGGGNGGDGLVIVTCY